MKNLMEQHGSADELRAIAGEALTETWKQMLSGTLMTYGQIVTDETNKAGGQVIDLEGHRRLVGTIELVTRCYLSALRAADHVFDQMQPPPRKPEIHQ